MHMAVTYSGVNKEEAIYNCEFYMIKELQLTQCSLLLSALYMFRAVYPPFIRSS